MNDQNSDLVNMCHDLYALEKEAHDIYEEFLHDLKNPHEKSEIESIHLDEEHHMKIASEMLKIAENE